MAPLTRGGRFGRGKLKLSDSRYTFKEQDDILSYYNEPLVNDYPTNPDDTVHLAFMHEETKDLDFDLELDGSVPAFENNYEFLDNHYDLDLELDLALPGMNQDASLMDDTPIHSAESPTATTTNIESAAAGRDYLTYDADYERREQQIVEFSKFRGINPYKCWSLYFVQPSTSMKQQDYEWCCIFEQYLEDELGQKLDSEKILRQASFTYDLAAFLCYYCRFKFIFEGSDMLIKERWLSDMPGFIRCLLVTVTEVFQSL
jgi:hypothetical protein